MSMIDYLFSDYIKDAEMVIDIDSTQVTQRMICEGASLPNEQKQVIFIELRRSAHIENAIIESSKFLEKLDNSTLGSIEFIFVDSLQMLKALLCSWHFWEPGKAQFNEIDFLAWSETPHYPIPDVLFIDGIDVLDHGNKALYMALINNTLSYVNRCRRALGKSKCRLVLGIAEDVDI